MTRLLFVHYNFSVTVAGKKMYGENSSWEKDTYRTEENYEKKNKTNNGVYDGGSDSRGRGERTIVLQAVVSWADAPDGGWPDWGTQLF